MIVLVASANRTRQYTKSRIHNCTLVELFEIYLEQWILMKNFRVLKVTIVELFRWKIANVNVKTIVISTFLFKAIICIYLASISLIMKKNY